jgi:hypothetical protein
VLRYLTVRVDESMLQPAAPAAPKDGPGAKKSEEDVAKAEPQT